MNLQLQTDRALVRASARSTRYVVASVVAPRAPERAARLPVNIALVLDRSGSMGGPKIALARAAVRRSLDVLEPGDRFAIVVYDNVVDVLVPSTHATSEAKRRALELLDAIEARGSTDLASGWLRGCEQVALHADGERVTRCLLLTDGLANAGITDRGALAEHATALRVRGVQTSTFGVGADFDERLLRDLAEAGSGNFYFIETATQIPDLLASELGEALEVTARGAALELALPRAATARPLQRFRHYFAEGDRELRLELGDLVSGQQMDVVIEVELDRGVEGTSVAIEARLTTSDSPGVTASDLVRWRYASHPANDRQQRLRAVDRPVARIYAARARAEAAELNRAGLYDGARDVLVRTARKIRSYAGDDAELLRLAAELEGETARFEAPMSPMLMKQAFFAASMAIRERTESGSAKR